MQDSGTETAGSREPLKLKFVGVLIEQLVAKLCPGTTATVVELISNEKDINAQNVCVTVPLGESWKPDKEIIVLDHGHEMTRDQLQKSISSLSENEGRRMLARLRGDGWFTGGRELGRSPHFGVSQSSTVIPSAMEKLLRSGSTTTRSGGSILVRTVC